MLSNKPSIQYLVEICARKGLQHAIISPGSRNAALNITFHGHGGFKCKTITDERVAAFIAMGISQQTQMPAILICTSGTAALNYAPAIAEAYYQKIPLLILTADRPPELIDKGIGQTIRQNDMYANFIKESYSLKPDTGDRDLLEENIQKIDAAINATMAWDRGPVHINIPMREPLYDISSNLVDDNLELQPVYHPVINVNQLITPELIDIWDVSAKILIIVGQSPRNKKLDKLLDTLTQRSDTILLSETTSHVYVDDFIQHIDRVIDSISVNKKSIFFPDLIISIGDAVVSKKVKIFLREAKAKYHWHIGLTSFFPDTYGSLSHEITADEVDFFDNLLLHIAPSIGDYSQPWLTLNAAVMRGHDQYIKLCMWSDMQAFSYIMPKLASHTVLHLANSTPVRYAQLFNYRQDITYLANRGVGGIDGSTSTAVGSAMANPHPHVLITGDLSFFYDSNALWTPDFPINLKVIIINNGGGNIFRIIQGPNSTEILEEVFEAHHQADIGLLVSAFGHKCIKIENYEQLVDQYDQFISNDSIQFMEIVTPRFKNDLILKQYFSHLKKSICQYA